jgi:hypothetical protein
MGNCCGAKAAFENAIRPVMARPHFDFNHGCSAVLVAAFGPNSGIDAHHERPADAAMGFADLATRSFDFLAFRPALQDFHINKCIRLR